MYKFGNQQPRLFDSFGVTGLLEEDCEVFYEDLFSTRHVGRVSDLLSAHLKSAGGDELRLRAVLLMSAFESYRSQISHSKWILDSEEKLATPIAIECGMDQEKIAVAASFMLPDDAPENLLENLPELKKRIQERKPNSPFEMLLCELSDQAHRLVFRAFPPQRKYEVVSLIGLAGRVPDQDMKEKDTVEVVIFDKEPQEGPRAKKYTELGDLNYESLLRDHLNSKKKSKGSGDDTHRIAGEGQEIDSSQRVRGSKEEEDDSVQIVSGGEGEQEEEVSASEVALLREQIKVLQAKIRDLEIKLGDSALSVKGADIGGADEEVVVVEESAGEAQEKKGKGLFGRMWPFKKAADDDDEDYEEVEEEVVEEIEEEVVEEAAESEATEGEVTGEETVVVEGGEPPTEEEVIVVKGSEEVEEPEPELAPLNLEGVSLEDTQKDFQQLDKAMNGGAFDTKIKEIRVHVGKNVKDEKAKAFMDQVLTDLTQEKIKVSETVKKVQQSLRQKEYEFKTKLLTYQDEVRKRDSLIKQKISAISHVKDQLSQANLNISRLRDSAKGSSADIHLKSKYNQLQLQMDKNKAENAELKKKIEEMKSRMASAKTKTGPDDAATQEITALKAEALKTSRLLEDQKKQNYTMQSRMAEQERRTLQKVDEMKARVEKAGKIATDKSRDLEAAKKRITELENLEKANQAQIETLKRKMEGGGGGDSQGNAA